MDKHLLGETIQQARVKKGWTQEQLAELLEISQIHLANIEGGRRNPSVPLLFQMMELLDFSVDGLVFPQGEGEPVLHTQGLSPREGPFPPDRRHAGTGMRAAWERPLFWGAASGKSDSFGQLSLVFLPGSC